MNMRPAGNDAHLAALALTHLTYERPDIEPGKLEVDEEKLAILVRHGNDGTCLIGSVRDRVSLLAGNPIDPRGKHKITTQQNQFHHSNRAGPLLRVADLNGFVHRQHEDFAVADVPLGTRAGDLFEALERTLDKIVVDRYLELDFPQQVDLVLCSAIRLGLASLASKPHGIADGKSGHADPTERLPYRIKLGRLDDCQNELHELGTKRYNALRIETSA